MLTMQNHAKPLSEHPSSDALLLIALQALSEGKHLEVRLGGSSMRPFIRNGELARAGPPPARPKYGMVLICTRGTDHKAGLIIHRVTGLRRVQGRVQIRTKGDAMPRDDGWWDMPQVVGRVVSVLRGGRWVPLDRGFLHYMGWLYSHLSRFSPALYSFARTLKRYRERAFNSRRS